MEIMSGWVKKRRFWDVRNRSVLPPKTDVTLAFSDLRHHRATLAVNLRNVMLAQMQQSVPRPARAYAYTQGPPPILPARPVNAPVAS